MNRATEQRNPTVIKAHSPDEYTVSAHPDTEQGSGTILTVGVLTVAMVAILLCLSAGSIHTHTARLQIIANAAALAGANISAVARWEEVGSRPCDLVREVVQINGVELSECQVIDSDCRVIVHDRVRILGVPAQVDARARAGPAWEGGQGTEKNS